MAAGTASIETDVTIVGGGMVGASLAAALRGTGVRVLLIESVPFHSGAQQSFDARTTALGNASRRIFGALGIWEQVAACAQPIRSIHVSEAGRFGFARLSAAEQGIEAFGYVLANRALGAALWAALQAAPDLVLRVPARLTHVEIGADAVQLRLAAGDSVETVRTRLVVAADGAHSQVRTAAGIAAHVEDYEQVAVVTSVAADQRAPRARSSCSPWMMRPTSPRCRAPSAGAPGASWAPRRAVPIRCSSRAPQRRWHSARS